MMCERWLLSNTSPLSPVVTINVFCRILKQIQDPEVELCFVICSLQSRTIPQHSLFFVIFFTMMFEKLTILLWTVFVNWSRTCPLLSHPSSFLCETWASHLAQTGLKLESPLESIIISVGIIIMYICVPTCHSVPVETRRQCSRIIFSFHHFMGSRN